MPKGTAVCNKIVALMYNATAWANVADNAASAPLTNVYMRLATASYGAGNNASANETAYTNYAGGVAVARTTGGWSAPAGGATANVAFGLGRYAQAIPQELRHFTLSDARVARTPAMPLRPEAMGSVRYPSVAASARAESVASGTRSNSQDAERADDIALTTRPKITSGATRSSARSTSKRRNSQTANRNH